MVKMASHKEKADVVFMDPPRSGSDKKFLDSLLRLRPKKVVYISCNPETLARDLKHLTGNGYRIKRFSQQICFLPPAMQKLFVYYQEERNSTKTKRISVFY